MKLQKEFKKESQRWCPFFSFFQNLVQEISFPTHLKHVEIFSRKAMFYTAGRFLGLLEIYVTITTEMLHICNETNRMPDTRNDTY